MFHIPVLAEKIIKDTVIQMKCCYLLIVQEFSVAFSEYLKLIGFFLLFCMVFWVFNIFLISGLEVMM